MRRISQALIQKETLDREELDRLLAEPAAGSEPEAHEDVASQLQRSRV